VFGGLNGRQKSVVAQRHSQFIVSGNVSDNNRTGITVCEHRVQSRALYSVTESMEFLRIPIEL
jgi:hypothetical protein